MIRTTQTTVSFATDFTLPGFDSPLPPGEYLVDHDEEAMEGPSRIAWRRVAAFIHLPAIGTRSSTRQMMPVRPSDLDAALEKDGQRPPAS